MSPSNEDIEVSRDAAEIIEEAVVSLLEDIGNGRQWGMDQQATRQNAEELADAYEELQAALEEGSE